MRLVGKIDMDNAAFASWPGVEASKLLRFISDAILDLRGLDDDFDMGGALVDSNGHRCGYWEVEP